MTDALCGPSNPLQNFQKHTAADRTLQQDRLTVRPGPSQGFRTSPGANAGILDAEFEAFQAGLPTAPPLSDPQLFHHTRQTPFANSASSPSVAPGWASDFQRLNITGEQLPTSQFHFSPQASLQRSAEQHGLTSGQRTAGWTPIQHKADGTQRSHAQLGVSRYTSYQPSMPEWYQMPSQAPSMMQHHQPQAQVEDVFDEAAFERAFEAARSDVQNREQQRQQETFELGNDVLIDESAGRLLQSDHLAEQELIGADAILHEAQDEPQEHQQTDDPDELARTAGQLLDSVKYEQSQKFQESNFLALMRRLRDREVRVEGDKMVDATQPLHPGGEHYPGDMDTTMSGAIPMEDNL